MIKNRSSYNFNTNVTSDSDFDFDLLGKKATALFIIVPAEDKV